MNTPSALPLWLTFAPADPTGATGLQADVVTGAALGTQVLSVLTAWMVRDTAAVESVRALKADDIDDQARSLLEDTTVAAIKVGALPSPEAASAVAQLLADYATVPAIVHLGEIERAIAAPDNAERRDATVQACLGLLVSQAHVAVVSHERLERWFSEGWLGGEGMETALQAFMALGPDNALVTGVPHGDGKFVNVFATGGPEAEAWSWERLPGAFLGAGSTLSAALTARLAQGAPLRQAVIDAQQFTRNALQSGFRPGMGRTLPDRHFWMRGSEPSSA